MTFTSSPFLSVILNGSGADIAWSRVWRLGSWISGRGKPDERLENGRNGSGKYLEVGMSRARGGEDGVKILGRVGKVKVRGNLCKGADLRR